jgi:chromosome segregation ATPase
MGMPEKIMISGRVPWELKQLVDSDNRDNQKVIEDALRREFGGTNKASIERRIDEKRQRVGNLETERNERDREIEQLQNEIEALNEQLNSIDENQALSPHEQYQEELTDILEAMDEGMSLHPTPPRIKRLARERYNTERKVDQVMKDLQAKADSYDIEESQWGDYA